MLLICPRVSNQLKDFQLRVLDWVAMLLATICSTNNSLGAAAICVFSRKEVLRLITKYFKISPVFIYLLAS